MDSSMGKNHSCSNATQASVSEYDIRLAAVCNLAAGLARELERLRLEGNTPQVSINLQEEVQKFEIDLIRAALISTGGNQRKAAKMLNMKISTLHTKVKRFKINKDQLFGPNE